jgi:hypothetical protein
VQAGVLEIHPWGSAMATIEQPDMIIMDLDPGEGVSWERVISAAHEVKERFSKNHLTTFVKTSGGKGLHVVAPLVPKVDWEAVKQFAKGVADAMAADSPIASCRRLRNQSGEARSLSTIYEMAGAQQRWRHIRRGPDGALLCQCRWPGEAVLAQPTLPSRTARHA